MPVLSIETQDSVCCTCLRTRTTMHAARPSACCAAATLLIAALLSCSAVSGSGANGAVTELSYPDAESTEQPLTSVEQTTDADFAERATNAASNEASSFGATGSWGGDPADVLSHKVEALSNDMLKFIQDLYNMNGKKQWKLHSMKDGSKAKDLNFLKLKLRKLLVKCVKRFGAKCVRVMPKYESGRRKREAQQSFKQHEVIESVDHGKNFDHFFPITPYAKPPHANVANEGAPENESVTQYVFRELQNLLYESRSELLDKSMEVKLVDVMVANPNEPSHSDFYSDFEAVSNPTNINRYEYRKTSPFLKSTSAQPARQNSFSTPDIFSKFSSSNPKNRLSEFHSQRTTFPSITESEANFASVTESHPYKSTHSTGRYPRSTTSQSSAFRRKEPHYFRTSAAAYPAREATQGYGDYVVDYITADYEATNPKQALKDLLSQNSYRDQLSENVQYEIVNSYPESYDDSDFPMYEYFVISEHSESEPSYLSLPSYQTQTYPPEKQVYEETRVPVQLVTGNRVSPASSTRFISTTPLSDDELYQIIKERIPSSSDQPQYYNIGGTTVKTLQQEPSKILAESQLTVPSNFEASSTPSYARKPTIHQETTKPLVAYVQESGGNRIPSDLPPEPAHTYAFKSSVLEETTKPLIVSIQESDDTNIMDFQAEPALSSETTTSGSTVVTNSYTANNLPTPNIPMVTKPITESTTTEQEIGLTTTLQDLITAIENQLGTTAVTVKDPLRTDIPMQVTVTSDEITVSGPDTQSISSLLYELRQPLLSPSPPIPSFVLPHVDSLTPVEVDPMQFAEFTSSVKKPPRKPSITTLFTGGSRFSTSLIPTQFQSVSEDVYRTSAPVQTEGLPYTTDEVKMPVSNSYGIPEFLIKSEILGQKLKPEVTATHIFGIPKEIIESELKDDPGEFEEPESLIMTSATNTAGKEPINLVEQHFVHELEDNSGDALPFNGIPLSMLNTELRTHSGKGDGYNLKLKHSPRDEIEQLSTPTSTLYVVDDESRSSTIPYLTTEKTDGSILANFMSLFSHF